MNWNSFKSFLFSLGTSMPLGYKYENTIQRGYKHVHYRTIEIWLECEQHSISAPFLFYREDGGHRRGPTWSYTGMSRAQVRVDDGPDPQHNQWLSCNWSTNYFLPDSSTEATLRILLGTCFILGIWQLVKL